MDRIVLRTLFIAQVMKQFKSQLTFKASHERNESANKQTKTQTNKMDWLVSARLSHTHTRIFILSYEKLSNTKPNAMFISCSCLQNTFLYLVIAFFYKQYCYFFIWNIKCWLNVKTLFSLHFVFIVSMYYHDLLLLNLRDYILSYCVNLTAWFIWLKTAFLIEWVEIEMEGTNHERWSNNWNAHQSIASPLKNAVCYVRALFKKRKFLVQQKRLQSSS